MTESPRLVRFAEVPELTGARFVGDPFTVETEEHKLFETVTWLDRVYIEPDPPEFPQGILEGFHTLALLDALQGLAAYRVDPAECYGFNYGLNRVRFPTSLRIGDALVPVFEVSSVERRAAGFLTTTQCELWAQGARKPGLVAEWLVLVLPRKGFELDI